MIDLNIRFSINTQFLSVKSGFLALFFLLEDGISISQSPFPWRI